MRARYGIIILTFILMLCSACGVTSRPKGPAASKESGTADKSDDAVADAVDEEEPPASDETKEAPAPAKTPARTEQKDAFVLKASPDKYTQYVDNYIGMNAASVGYFSLGGDRLISMGAGTLKVIFVAADGTFVDPEDEEVLKKYVVTGQSIAPNGELKYEFEKDSEGVEYDNLLSFQSHEEIDLAVKPVGTEDVDIPLTQVNAAADRYTYYVRNYVGKNLASVGYLSWGDELRDSYGAASVLLNVVSDDGSYVDVSDETVLKQYVVVEQNILPNSELKLTYLKDDEGEEYSNLVNSQSYDAITLRVSSITGEPVVSKKEETPDEKETKAPADFH